MNRRAIVIFAAAFSIGVFSLAGYFYDQRDKERLSNAGALRQTQLFRPHSPIIGPIDAPVTIVEFFDPSCETCRAFHPIVKEILARFRGEVRLVIRYTPLHEGSDEAVRILEAARRQNMFEPILEVLLREQPTWARHGAPNLNYVWEAAGQAGLDLPKARRDALLPEVGRILEQDVADVQALGVKRTPTFFVNGQQLLSFGAQQLFDLVRAEVDKVKGAN